MKNKAIFACEWECLTYGPEMTKAIQKAQRWEAFTHEECEELLQKINQHPEMNPLVKHEIYKIIKKSGYKDLISRCPKTTFPERFKAGKDIKKPKAVIIFSDKSSH